MAKKGKHHDVALPNLRALEEGDVVNVCRWMTSSYILQHSFVVPSAKSLPDDFATSVYAARYFDMLLSDHHRMSFAITVNGQHVGNVGLKEISFATRSAECFIEIGERSSRGRGVGIAAMQRLLDIAFFDHDLALMSLDVLEFNFPAIKVYSRLGFVTTHQTGWHYDEFGQYWRVISMNITREVWHQRRKTLHTCARSRAARTRVSGKAGY